MQNNKAVMAPFLRHYRRKFPWIFLTLSLLLAFYYIEPKSYLRGIMEDSPALQELNFYIGTLREQCNKSFDDTDFEMKFQKPVYFPKPTCENLLRNLTRGGWVHRSNLDSVQVMEVELLHKVFRKQVGIPVITWRSDKKCGYENLAAKVSKWWPQTGAFCDPQGPTPCCTNIKSGKCVAMESATTCDCDNCVNTRSIQDALFSAWHPADERCTWTRYSSSATCAVLNSLSNPNSMAHFYFVGDSLIRNMYMGLTTILTNNTPRGIYRKCLSRELRKLCWGENLFLRRPCHDLAIGMSLEELEKSKELCDGKRYFKAEFKGFGQPQQASDFIKFVKSLYGKENTYVILAVGLHFSSDDQSVINKFLDPILLGKRHWPRILWVHPTSIGLLKPPAFMAKQGDEAIRTFAGNIETYLRRHHVPVFDFRPITRNVRSYDGTHYGTGVNMMKAQILINYLAALK